MKETWPADLSSEEKSLLSSIGCQVQNHGIQIYLVAAPDIAMRYAAAIKTAFRELDLDIRAGPAAGMTTIRFIAPMW